MDHARPHRAAFYNALVGLCGPAPAFDEHLFAAPMAAGESVLMPIVDQTRLHRAIQPELRQYLSEYPMFSIVGAPIVAGDTVRGSVMLSRDTPSAPYTPEDATFVRRLADRIGTLVRTADEIEQAWQLRRQLMAAITGALATRRPGLPFTGVELQELLYSPGRFGATSALASMVLSPDDRVLAFNPAAERMLGYSPRELHGRRRDEALLPVEALESETDAHARLRSGEVDFHDSHALRVRADGTEIDLAVHRGAVRDPGATLACVVGVARPLRVGRSDPPSR